MRHRALNISHSRGPVGQRRAVDERWTLPLFLVAVLGLGCGEATAIDIALVPDPNATDVTELLEHISTIELVIDAASALYPDREPARVADVELVDVDRDGRLEVVGEISTAGRNHLPSIRVERGSLPFVPLELRFEGIIAAQERRMASGGVAGVTFAADTVRPIDVPFNTMPSFRPPRVLQVLPPSGSIVSPEVAMSIVLVFSKRMDEATLTRPGTITLVSLADGERLHASRAIYVQQLGRGDDSLTTAEYRLPAPPQVSGPFRITVSSEALDATLERRALDQIPLQPGLQPFSSQFTVSPRPATQLPGGEFPQESHCSEGGTACPPEMSCAAGHCLPLECADACSPASVCDPQLRLCVSDCRLSGSAGCPADRPSCQPNGLCDNAP